MPRPKKTPAPTQPPTIIRKSPSKDFGRTSDSTFAASGSFAGSQFRKDARDGRSAS